jgi:hypothetical protein
MVAIAVPVPISVVIMEIPRPVMVPAMIMFQPAVLAFPIAFVETLSIVMRPYPASSCVRGPSPIAFVPAVVPSYWVPITLYPDELRAGRRRQNTYDTSRRWRTNPDSNGDLSKHGKGKQQSSGNKAHPEKRFALCEIHGPAVLLNFRRLGNDVVARSTKAQFPRRRGEELVILRTALP